jgi:hypothetical protein
MLFTEVGGSAMFDVVGEEQVLVLHVVAVMLGTVPLVVVAERFLHLTAEVFRHAHSHSNIPSNRQSRAAGVNKSVDLGVRLFLYRRFRRWPFEDRDRAGLAERSTAKIRVWRGVVRTNTPTKAMPQMMRAMSTQL